MNEILNAVLPATKKNHQENLSKLLEILQITNSSFEFFKDHILTLTQEIENQIVREEKNAGEIWQKQTEIDNSLIVINQGLQQLTLQWKGTEEALSPEIRNGFINIECKLEDIKASLDSLREIESNFHKKFDVLFTLVRGKEYPLDIRFERNYYQLFPVNPSLELREKLLELITGLDSISIKTIITSLQRLRRVLNSPESHHSLLLYSETEKAERKQIIENFQEHIFSLSDNCFYYQGYFLPINHFESCVFWDKCGIKYLEHLEHIGDSDIIDAGAFIGDSALILSDLTQGNVHAFEPVPSNYKQMLETIQMNKRTNIIPCPFALGDKRETIQLSVSDSCSTQFANQAMNYTGMVEANVVTLDEYVEEHQLKIGLIKADIEGAEQLLLRGAIKTIKAQKPALLISIYHNEDDFFGIKPLIDSLGLGYRFKIRKPVCGTVMTEMLLIAEILD